MAFGIYILIVICLLTNMSKTQLTTKQPKMTCQAQLSEVNARMQALQRRMDNFVTDNQKQIEELKHAFTAQVNSVSKIPSDDSEYFYFNGGPSGDGGA